MCTQYHHHHLSEIMGAQGGKGKDMTALYFTFYRLTTWNTISNAIVSDYNVVHVESITHNNNMA